MAVQFAPYVAERGYPGSEDAGPLTAHVECVIHG